jgi:hypothetical protein
LKKRNNFRKKNEQPSKRTKSRGQVQRDTKHVLAELVAKLQEKLDSEKVAAASGGGDRRGELRPHLDRLTVGGDLGDQWSHYRILGLAGETLAEDRENQRLRRSDRKRKLDDPDPGRFAALAIKFISFASLPTVSGEAEAIALRLRLGGVLSHSLP